MRKHRAEPEKVGRGHEIGDECDAFLAGEWAEHLAENGQPVPQWAWVNQVAHGSEERMRDLATQPAWRLAKQDEWTRLRACVADALFSRARQNGATVAEVQLHVLVPLELMLLGDKRLQQLGSAQLLIRTLSVLHHPSAQSH
jgi:hypothetical protein